MEANDPLQDAVFEPALRPERLRRTVGPQVSRVYERAEHALATVARPEVQTLVTTHVRGFRDPIKVYRLARPR